MAADEWVAATRVKRGRRWVFVRDPESPVFNRPGLVLEWCRKTGRVTRVEDTADELGHYYQGWGDPWFACVMAGTVAA